MNVKIIPFQPPLSPVLPTIEGNVDYRLFRDQLQRIEQQLLRSGLETQFIQADLQTWMSQNQKVTAKAQQNRQLHCRRALRCNIARTLLNEDYRGFAARLADSPLLQWFCGLNIVPAVVVPAKSTVQRYAVWWPEEQVRQLVYQLIQTGAQQPEKLDLEKPQDLDAYFLDTTCLADKIHYPVDWVLLRDGTRAHTDESTQAHSSAGLEASDGSARAVPQSDEPAVHGNEPRQQQAQEPPQPQERFPQE